MGTVVSAAVSLVSFVLTDLLYGEAYSESAAILQLHIFAGVFVALGIAVIERPPPNGGGFRLPTESRARD